MIKVLFLDVDGVVNSEKTFERSPRGVIGIDPYLAFMVGQIILVTDAKLVLSSSWRGYKEGEEEIEKQIYPIYDKTPHLDNNGIRGVEIKEWLKKHSDVETYAILDDDDDMLPEQKKNFFQTSFKEGITEKIRDQVIEHLNKKLCGNVV